MRYSLLFIVFLLNSCASPILIVSQDKLTNFPCNTSDNGINVRIKNIGLLAFSQVNLNQHKKQISYPGLRPGETTCYKNVESVWTNNDFEIVFLKKKGYVMRLVTQSVDHVGEKEIKHGYVTFNIEVTRSHDKYSYTSKLIIDKN